MITKKQKEGFFILPVTIMAIKDETDRNFVEKLYCQYGSTMLSIAKSILADDYAAEDAVSQAFVKIIDHLQKFSFENCNKTRGLIVIIVKHICWNMLKNEKREQPASFEDWSDIPESPDQSPPNLTVSKEDFELVLSCIAQLKESYRNILYLKLLYGFTYEELAGLLELSQQNIRVRYCRAKNALITELKKRGNTVESV